VGAIYAIAEKDGSAFWHTMVQSGYDSWSPKWIKIHKKDFRLNGCPWDKSLRPRPGKENAR
jgi:hypothetical protein